MQYDQALSYPRLNRVLSPFREFFRTESSGGILLLLATVIALAWANSPWSGSYFDLWETYFTISLGDQLSLSKSLHHWINDGLMVIFFLVVGLEIKREVLVGELSSPRHALLPIAAAIGGAIVPAIIFISLNSGNEVSSGWGIPMATDIAFALGVLALLGSRAPITLKVFLAALAIVDDILAVLVIALFYTGDLAWEYLLVGLAIFALLVVANRLHLNRPVIYAIGGVGLWLAFLQSGVHATVAGVLLAMTVPARNEIDTSEFIARGQRSIDEFRSAGDLGKSMLTNHNHQAALNDLQSITARAETPIQRFQHTLHPWVSFVIVPLFAFANVGVVVGDQFPSALTTSLGAGIVVGLLVGKQSGILLLSWLVVRLGLAPLPPGITWRHLYGVAWLAGIGFTMSLFITELAFESPEMLEAAKMSVLVASLVAGVGGWLVLRAAISSTGDDDDFDEMYAEQPVPAQAVDRAREPVAHR